MRATRILVVTATGLLLAAAGSASGQSFGGQGFGGQGLGGQSALRAVEDKIGGTPATGASDTTPGSGYLGGEFDDPRAGQKGVLVINVRPRGPAELSGLKPNDLITSIDAKPVAGLTDLDAVLDKAIVGQRLRMTVNRVGRMENITVTLGTRPPPPSPAELNPGEAPPDAPGTLPTPGTLPAPATPRSPALGSPALGTLPPGTPAPGTPALGTPALGSPSAPVDRPATGGAFSPPGATSPRTDAGAPTPAPPGDAGSGIRARPFDAGSSPPATTPSEVTPIAPAETAPGPAEPGAAPGTGGGPSLGITVNALTEEARQAYGLTVRRGALIVAVRPGSPADRAGLPVGGVVVQLDGRRVETSDELVSLIQAAQPGQEVELTYFEGSRLGRKSVTLAPVSTAAAPGSLPRGSGGITERRPLVGRTDRMIDGFARGGVSGPSTVYDPSVVAALQSQVAELNATVKDLEQRLRALEGSRGATASPTPAPAITPGFGSAPIGPATPGFVPGLAPPGTTP